MKLVGTLAAIIVLGTVRRRTVGRVAAAMITGIPIGASTVIVG
jgi:hypothetical protein